MNFDSTAWASICAGCRQRLNVISPAFVVSKRVVTLSLGQLVPGVGCVSWPRKVVRKSSALVTLNSCLPGASGVPTSNDGLAPLHLTGISTLTVLVALRPSGGKAGPDICGGGSNSPGSPGVQSLNASTPTVSSTLCVKWCVAVMSLPSPDRKSVVEVKRWI